MKQEKIDRGVYVDHAAGCTGTKEAKTCKCDAPYLAKFFDKRTKKRLSKTFPTLAAARGWRADLTSAAGKGVPIAAPSRLTVGDALDSFMEGVESGAMLNRSGKVYKPSTMRSYRRAVTRYLQPEIGSIRLTELRRADVKGMADRLRASGLKASTIANVVDPLRALYRDALDRELVANDPTDRLCLPSARSDAQDRRSVGPVEAERLIEALPESERALWATAIYAGLRRGELQALRVSDLDLTAELLTVDRSWDDEGGAIVATKTKAGNRTVPILAPLLPRLAAHLLTTGRWGDDYVFGSRAEKPFVPWTVRDRAVRAWKSAGPESITLHEGRHSAATMFARAGLDDLALTRIMGHSNVTVTIDVYGHLRDDHMPDIRAKLNASIGEALAD